VCSSDLIVNKNTLVKDVNGQETLARTVVWLLGTPTITPEDKLVLPDATEPPIINTESFPDDEGDHHTKVYLG